jgi:predicted secreted hydrolase
LETENGKVDVVLKPRENALYNGTTGLLRFGPTYEFYGFAFPNMEIEGTVTIKGKEYRVEHTTAWLDRQWGIEDASTMDREMAWLWLGMTLNNDASEAVSLWDLYSPGERNAFATILTRNGTQVNVDADVTYDKTWTSSRSGNQYPGQVHIAIPTVDLDITLTALLDEPESVRSAGATGCQSLCAVKGSYKGTPINRHVIVEMIGDLCGE